MTAIRLQPLTRAKVAALGEVGTRWLAALPEVLADLERAWFLILGRSLSGGSCSYVTRATRTDGELVIVKVAVPSDDLSGQAQTLELAEGRGYVRLLRFDPPRNAMLLEALGDPLERSTRTPENQLRTLADTLRLAWLPVGEAQLPAPGQDKASGLHALISDLWPRLGHPCPENVVAQALDYAIQLRDPPLTEMVRVHGDPHPGNALAVTRPRPGAETGYCFVDPDGFVADRAYDLGVTMRDWCSHLGGANARRTAEGYAQLLAERSGVDRDRIWRWGYLERVSSGLYLMSFGATELGRRFLTVAQRLVDRQY